MKDGTNADRSFDPGANPEMWLKQDDASVYTSQAAAQGFVTIHYQRPDGDYTGWGLHLWGDAIEPGEATEWAAPKPPDGVDEFGAYWNVAVQDVTLPVNFIVHHGDEKDPGPDQSMIPADDASIWLQSGDTTIHGSRGAAEDYADDPLPPPRRRLRRLHQRRLHPVLGPARLGRRGGAEPGVDAAREADRLRPLRPVLAGRAARTARPIWPTSSTAATRRTRAPTSS